MANAILAQTIGFELETENLVRGGLKLPSGFQQTQDASIESDGLVAGSYPVVLHGDIPYLNVNRAMFGVEILSGIVDTEDNYLPTLKALCHSLYSQGESEQSQRAGFHVHLSFHQTGLKVLKEVLKLGAYLEDVFFLLGGMGYEFRGLKNDSIYCRPITDYGPQVVQVGSRYYPSFVLKDCLEARTSDEFEVRLGNLNRLAGNRYVPIRYVWLNLYNLYGRPPKGTLEFRLFNKSLNPMYLYTVIELCKHFGQTALAHAYSKDVLDLPVHSVFDYRPKHEIVNTFIEWVNEREIQPEVVNTAMEIMDRTPIDSIRLPKQWVFSHLIFHRGGNRCPSHWEDDTYKPSIVIPRDSIKKPDFIDIHNLRSTEEESNTRTARTPSTIEEAMEDMSRRLNDIRSTNRRRENSNEDGDIPWRPTAVTLSTVEHHIEPNATIEVDEEDDGFFFSDDYEAN